MSKIIRYVRPIILLFLIGLLVWVSIFYDVEQLLDQELIQSRIEQNYLLGLFLFIGIVVLLKLLLVPVTMTSVIAGYLFGGFVGSLISVFALSVSGVIQFSLARELGQDFVERYFKTAQDRFQKYYNLIGEHGFLSVLFFRIVPILPHIVVNVGFGLTTVRYATFCLATALGSLPGVILLSNIGSRIVDYTSPTLYILITVYAVIIGSTTYLAHRLKEKRTSK